MKYVVKDFNTKEVLFESESYTECLKVSQNYNYNNKRTIIGIK